MSGKRIAGIVCLVFAALFLISGVSSMTRAEGPALGDPSGLGVSRAVGRFLPSLIIAIVGLWLLKKPVSRDAAKPGATSDPAD
uniref:Uncharacterized protein n=1 Tax=Schlesneria paludicola TaxID=360056 RepID=A0A7C4QMJ8_9PLAN